jgi:hypothetical protein
MNIKDILDQINIPPLIECGQILDKYSRLKSFFHILEIAEETNNAQETLELINNKLVDVEDCHSGLSQEEDPGLKFNGRMYPIMEDNIERLGNGRIIAHTLGNKIIIESNGAFTILTRIEEQPLLEKKYGN